MTLYEIDAAITALIDTETGEIADFEAFEGLQMARDEKIENTALFIKNLTAEAEAIKAEEKKLAERRKAAENKAERLTNLLDQALNGQTFKTARCVCQYRRSQSVLVDDAFIDWARDNADDLLTYTDPKPNKTKIKEAIKAGREIHGAAIVDGLSFSIK